jgi:hypothetical protein
MSVGRVAKRLAADFGTTAKRKVPTGPAAGQALRNVL